MNKNSEFTTNNTYNKLDTQQTENPQSEKLNERNPPLYKIVDKLFAKATEGKYPAAEYEGKSKRKPAVAAVLLGGGIAAAATGVIDIGARVLAPEFHAYTFHHIQVLCGSILAGGILWYSDKIGKWAKEHPVYTAGMAAVAAACYATTIADILIK